MTPPSPPVRDPAEPDRDSLAVVGIGASAGGLEALERFLGNVPDDSGLAFVVIQHLDPTQSSMIAELLQRATAMPVLVATQRMVVHPNTVIVIPPGKDLSFHQGRLRLDASSRNTLHLPIDTFLCSLAEELHDNAIGVILSGMGSDGTRGFRTLRENGGLTLAQAPSSAEFDSMPKSAIEAGLVDIVAPPEDLPGLIIAWRRQSEKLAADGPITEAENRAAFDEIITLLRDRTRTDFSFYKITSLSRRIERRVTSHRIESFAAYARFLRDNPQEIDLLFKELLIGVTNFFRDPMVWDVFKTQALPALLAVNPPGRVVRAWVPACSTGEEAYSLAIAFCEAQEQIAPHSRITLHIYATDLDADAISRARQGIYPETIVADVSPERLSRYFVAEERGFRIAKDIREMVTFAEQNIISDPPFTKLDILSCRNLLIYFGPEVQKSLLPMFHFSLNPDGLLLLGSAETIGGFSRLFTPIDQKARLFRRIDHPVMRGLIGFPNRLPPHSTNTMGQIASDPHPESLQALMERLLLKHFAPAAVLIKGDGDILYVSGRTGKYLEPAAGKANLNIHAMARDGIRQPLTTAIRRALRQETPIILPGLTVMTDAGPQMVTVTVMSVDRPDAMADMVLAVFTDVERPAAESKTTRRNTATTARAALAEDLDRTREELEITRAEMQNSLEALKSANEEQQATNEELQSANEELTTSKEEMQSMNEELHSVNAELQSKIDDLMWVNNDMNNLLNSTEIATVFLNNDLRLRRFTPHATLLFKLIASDVGRPLSDIVTDLIHPGLSDDAREVLRTLVFTEKQIPTRDGRWIKVRIMPYRTQDNVIDGVVITFLDITEIKTLDAELSRFRGEPPSN
jgi:chemotaxis methyl-accepting protein methylase